jgi:hypothetical protein
MTEFSVSPFKTSSVAYLYRLRDNIQVNPVYQRQGEVWSRTKQRLLIDSIINKFDIPKIYFHQHTNPLEINGRRIRYSLVDGRQRLEALWDFIDGRFALAEDFMLLEDNSTEPAGMTYSELEEHVPEVAALFSATSLDVMLIQTEDVELIEEMFSRLNEAVPLNAAEKRNGKGGPLRAAVRELVEEKPFFIDRLPFGNNRYRHFDLATKFLYWIDRKGPADAKKQQLDDFWDDIHNDAKSGQRRATSLLTTAKPILNALAGTFQSKDTLLTSVGMVSVYYLLYQALLGEKAKPPARSEFVAFDQARRLRRSNDERFNDEADLTEAERRLLEFDRLAQSPNDESALKYRLSVLRDFLSDPSAFTSSDT